MNVAPSTACYLYYSQYLLPRNTRAVKRIITVSTLLIEQASYMDCHSVAMFSNVLTPFSTGLWRQ